MIYLERKGLPTVSIASAGFQKDTVATAKAFGMETAPFVTIPCVITSVSPEESAGEIEKQIDSIINGLTNPDSLTVSSSNEEAHRSDGPSLVFSGENDMDAWEAFNSEFLERGWGDGLPLIPPTRENPYWNNVSCRAHRGTSTSWYGYSNSQKNCCLLCYGRMPTRTPSSHHRGV